MDASNSTLQSPRFVGFFLCKIWVLVCLGWFVFFSGCVIGPYGQVDRNRDGGTDWRRGPDHHKKEESYKPSFHCPDPCKKGNKECDRTCAERFKKFEDFRRKYRKEFGEFMMCLRRECRLSHAPSFKVCEDSCWSKNKPATLPSEAPKANPFLHCLSLRCAKAPDERRFSDCKRSCSFGPGPGPKP